jgi:hypothetical protein
MGLRRAKPDQLINAYAGVNLSAGKNVLADPKQGRATFGGQEKVFTGQNQLASKKVAGLKLDFTLLAKGVSQLGSQASHAVAALLPPEREAIGRIAHEIEGQLPDLLVWLRRIHYSSLLLYKYSHAVSVYRSCLRPLRPD